MSLLVKSLPGLIFNLDPARLFNYSMNLPAKFDDIIDHI